MKKAIILSTLSLLLITTYPVLAEDSTASSTNNTRRENAQQRVEARKEIAQVRLEDIRAKIASRTAQLRARLQLFKDKRKATLVERINDTLAMINKNQTDQMKKHLGKMSEILAKLENRTNQASSSGQNTASASAAINNAKAAIASASAALNKQAAMDYTINVSTESAVRVDAKAARDRLHTDLLTTRRFVIAAKQALANAIRVVATTLKGVKYGQQ